MKRAALILIAGTVALAAARQTFTYRDKTGALTVTATSGLVTQQASNRIHLELKGSPVVLNSAKDGVRMSAPKIVCDANSSGQTKLEKAVATGGLNARKTAGNGTTDIAAGSGTYTAGAQSSQMSLQGSVKIVSRTGARTTTVTGKGGAATFAPGTNGEMKRATLGGPVRIEADQQGSPNSHVVATGNRLDLDNVARTVTLSGNVNVTGGMGELKGASRVTLVLNAKGEVSSVRVSRGASQ